MKPATKSRKAGPLSSAAACRQSTDLSTSTSMPRAAYWAPAKAISAFCSFTRVSSRGAPEAAAARASAGAMSDSVGVARAQRPTDCTAATATPVAVRVASPAIFSSAAPADPEGASAIGAAVASEPSHRSSAGVSSRLAAVLSCASRPAGTEKSNRSASSDGNFGASGISPGGPPADRWFFT